MDFINDLRKELETYFARVMPKTKLCKLYNKIPLELANQVGVQRVNLVETTDLLERFLNYDNRNIRCIKRNVKRSKELENNLTCDEFKQYSSVVDEIEDSLRNGKCIDYRISKQVGRGDTNDKMLNGWRIYHFHLGEKRANKKYCERTGELLMVYIPWNEDTAYMVDIIPQHNNDGCAFANVDYLNIIDKNWPKLLKEYEIKGKDEFSSNLTINNRVKLQRKNIMTAVNVNGKMILPPGIGYALDGSSIPIRIKASKLCEKVIECQKQYECSKCETDAVHLKLNDNDWCFEILDGESVIARIPY